MADFTKFRTSVGGFNRSDVADYIEALCTEQKKACKALEDEKQSLASQLEEAQISLTAKERELQALRQKLEETETALAASESALGEALELADAQTAPAEQPQAEQQEEKTDFPAKELEAYRRAEATERLAAERAGRLRSRLSSLLDNVSGRYEQTGQEIQALSEDIRTNLQRMQEALSDLDVIFDETTDAFETLDAPETETTQCQEDAE